VFYYRKDNSVKVARLDYMEQFILDNHSVTLDDLCKEFDISLSTLRRDLNELVSRGRVTKVYGGVKAVETGSVELPLLSYEERDIVHKEEKRIICEQAARMVEEHDVIYVDTGTTCMQMIEYLKDIPCTLITNSLQVAMSAVNFEKLDVIMMPGRLKRETRSFIDIEVDKYLSTLNIDKAFMATTGFSMKNGLTNASESEFIVKKAVVKNSDKIYLLADSDKFERMALYTYCRFRDIDCLITNERPSEEYVEYCKEHNIDLIY